MSDHPTHIFGVLVCRRAQKRASTSFTVTFLGSGNIYKPTAGLMSEVAWPGLDSGLQVWHISSHYLLFVKKRLLFLQSVPYGRRKRQRAVYRKGGQRGTDDERTVTNCWREGEADQKRGFLCDGMVHAPGNGATGKLPRGGGSLAVNLVILLRDGRRCIGALDGTPVDLALFCWRLTKGSGVEVQRPRGETWCESDPLTPACRTCCDGALSYPPLDCVLGRRGSLLAAPRCSCWFITGLEDLGRRKEEGDAWRYDGGVVLACEGLFVERNAHVASQAYFTALLFVALSSPARSEVLR